MNVRMEEMKKDGVGGWERRETSQGEYELEDWMGWPGMLHLSYMDTGRERAYFYVPSPCASLKK